MDEKRGEKKNPTTKLTLMMTLDVNTHTLTSVDSVAYLKYNVEDDSVMDRLALVRSIYVFVLVDCIDGMVCEKWKIKMV